MSEKLKPGYKQTEGGVIPEEWEVQSLEGIADPKRPICYGIVQVGPFTRNGIPVLAIKNLNTDYLTNVHRSSPEIETPYARSRVSPGDVLISVKGTTGRVGIVPLHFDGNISRDIARLRLTDEDMPEFWFQMLQSETAQRKLGVATVGTTRMELSIGILKHVRMPRPPKEEQRAIAGALSDVDALIGALDRLIAKKRDLKQAAMQQLLIGETRLPGFSGEWGVKSNGALAGGDENIVDGPFGSNLKNSDYTPTGVPVLQGLNITGDKFVWKEVRYISEKKAKEVFRSNAQIGDLLTVKIGSVGFSALIDYLDGHRFAIIPANLLRVRFRGTACDPHFLYYALSSTRGKRTLKDLAANTAQPALGLTGFRKLLVPVPNSIKEQTAIAAVFSDMDAEIDALEARRDKTRALKQGMMQELLTGRTRLA